MADFTALIAQIEAYVKQNGNNEITGNGLQDILVAMVGAIGGALNDAVSDLESADTTLTNAIGEEELARQGGDNTLGGRITAEEEARQGADTGLQNQINGINGKIPDAASNTNKLADKAFVQGLVDALTASIAAINDKIPSEASSSNKLADKAFVQALTTALQNALNTLNGKVPAAATSENQLADKAFVTSLTTALQNAINAINTNIGNGFVYAGVATPSGTPVSGKVAYLTAQEGTYTNYGDLFVPAGISVIKYDGTDWSQEQVISMETIYCNPLMGLYDCDTSGSTAAKTVTAVGYVLPTSGGAMKVRMASHTTVDNVTLNINGTGAKDLYYKGKAAGINNTWDDGAVLNVIYDSTNDRYLSYNANAGTGDGVFDVSEYTGDDYATLEDAIADIPVSEQHGGMEMRFVRSSDNKYVQYFLTKNTWSVSEGDWQKMNLEEEVSQLGQEVGLFNSASGQCSLIEIKHGYIGQNGSYTAAENSRTLYFDITGIPTIIVFGAKTTLSARYVCFYDDSLNVIKAGLSYKSGDYLLFDVPTGATRIALLTVLSNNGIELGAVVFDYSYMFSQIGRIDACESQIKNLNAVVFSGLPELNYNMGSYIQGDHINTYANSYYTDAVELKKGSVISITNKSFGASNPILSKYDPTTGKYSELIAGSNQVDTRTYTLTETCYVAISGYQIEYLTAISCVAPTLLDYISQSIISALSTSVQQSNTYTPSYSIIDNKYINRTGQVVELTDTFMTSPIDVRPGAHLVGAIRPLGSSDSPMPVCFLVADGKYLPLFSVTTSVPSTQQSFNFEVTDAIQVCFTGYKKAEFSLSIQNPTIEQTFIVQSDTLHKNKWSGKKWAAIGDSLTHHNLRALKNYHDYVHDWTGISVVNMGTSGSGYKENEQYNVAFRQKVVDIPKDSDVITIFGSGNDLHRNAQEEMIYQFGDITDNTSDTICGCINLTFDYIQEHFPLIPLGVVTPTPWKSANMIPSVPGNNMDIYVEKLIAICERRGIPYLDLYHCSNLHPESADFRNVAYRRDGAYTLTTSSTPGAVEVTEDNIDIVHEFGASTAELGDYVLPDLSGVHPDEDGHKFIAPRFIGFLESLIEG